MSIGQGTEVPGCARALACGKGVLQQVPTSWIVARALALRLGQVEDRLDVGADRLRDAGFSYQIGSMTLRTAAMSMSLTDRVPIRGNAWSSRPRSHAVV